MLIHATAPPDYVLAAVPSQQHVEQGNVLTLSTKDIYANDTICISLSVFLASRLVIRMQYLSDDAVVARLPVYIVHEAMDVQREVIFDLKPPHRLPFNIDVEINPASMISLSDVTWLDNFMVHNNSCSSQGVSYEIYIAIYFH